MSQTVESSSSPQLSSLSLLLNSELIRWLVTELMQFWKERQFHGTYKVLSHEATIELIDKHGKRAVYTKRQKLEFVQNDVFAILDQAGGDGELFDTYRCSLGVAVDKYREGLRWKILIALRGTRNRGDQEDLFVERTIVNGFSSSFEYWETFIDHPTKEFTLTAIFPKTRLPKNVELIEEHTKRTYKLGSAEMTNLSHGRVQYQWHQAKPRLFEGYILRWQW